MQNRVIRMVVLFVVVAGVGIYFKMSQRSEVGKKARAEADVLLAEIEGYEANRSFYDMFANLAHESAMNDAFKMGGRRTQSTFDEGIYLSVFFDRLRSHAQAQNKQEIVRAINDMCEEQNIPAPGSP